MSVKKKEDSHFVLNSCEEPRVFVVDIIPQKWIDAYACLNAFSKKMKAELTNSFDISMA